MSTVPKYVPHYTVADYQLWEGDWELWNGVAVAMVPSPFGEHSRLTAELARILGNAIAEANCNATVLVEIDWIVFSDTVLRPDVTVVCGGAPEKHLEEPPAIVVEILSDGTRQRDLTVKRDLYASRNVGWYLIVDPADSALTVLKLGDDGEYLDSEFGDVPVINICGDCSIQLNIERMFR